MIKDIRCSQDQRMTPHILLVVVRISLSNLSGQITIQVRRRTTRLLVVLALFASDSRSTQSCSKKLHGSVLMKSISNSHSGSVG